VLLRAIAAALLPLTAGPADFLARAVRVSAEPALLPRFRFGRHKGVPIAEVPTDYLEWVAGEEGMGADAAFTARHQLALRGAA